MSWETIVAATIAGFAMLVAWVQYALRVELRRDVFVLRAEHARLNQAYVQRVDDVSRLGDVLAMARRENTALRAELSRRLA